MKKIYLSVLTCFLSALVASSLFAAPLTSAEVVVIGGTDAGVSAALAAKKAGADVILLESRPALGSDTAGKLIIEKEDGALQTPLSIRKSLDKKLLDAKIPFRTWVYVKDIIRNTEGGVAGVVTVSRSGERFIAAKCVIDATERAYASKRAGGEFAAFPAGEYTVRRRVVSGDAPKAKGMEVKLIGTTGVHKIGKPVIDPKVKEIEGKLWECSIKIKMDDGSALSYAKMEQLARDKTWTFKQIESAETCLVDAPDKLINDARGVFTCGPLGKLKPEEAGRLASQYARNATSNASRLDPPQSEVIDSYDSAVAGLGTGGASALVALSRAGVKAIGFEYSYRSGGLTTEGLIGIYYYGNRVGFTAELDEALKKMGLIYSQTKENFFRSRSRRATTVYGSFVYGVVKEGRVITALKVMLADGAPAIVPVKTVVDATGNCDVAFAAGEKTEYILSDELSLQGAAFMRKRLGHSYLNLDWAFINDCDAEDLWYLSLRGRNSYEDSSVNWDQSQVVDSRERRRLVGLYRVTPQDVMLNRTYPDIVCITRSNFDTHGQTVDPQFLIVSTEHKPLQVNLPYRAILPRETDNLAVIGLGLSASRDAMPILRMIPDVQNQGWVAAKACEHALREKKALKDIDIKALQQALIRKKVLPSWVLEAKDNLPLSDDAIASAVKDVADNYKSLAAVFSDPARSVPLMEKAYKATEDEKAKLIYAHVLGMLGSNAGEKTLAAAIRVEKWDKGWEYRGMGQFGRPVSWIDSYIIALAKSKASLAAEDVAKLAAKIDSKSEYSHIRAIAMYFEAIGNKKYAPLLASKLSLPGISGNYFSWEKNGAPAIADYSVYNFKSKKKELCRGAAAVPDGERSYCLKELSLARALYRIGDFNGLAKRTLEAYLKDPRRAYAEHARLVLGRDVSEFINTELQRNVAQASELYMAGDSIMADYRSQEWPQYGWGQSLKSFMKNPERLHNFARSGWSARRFRESGRWEKCIASKLKPGDWVIVSFGHNDMNKRRNKPPKNDYSTIDEYKAFLKGFAADVKSKGANIAFATSIAHSKGFSEKDGVMTVDGGATGLGPYVAAMREVASEVKAPILDLNRYAEENLPKLGMEKAKALYMFVKPGEYANYPKGKNDAAHVRDLGAFFYAKGAVEMAFTYDASLKDFFKTSSIVTFVLSVE